MLELLMKYGDNPDLLHWLEAHPVIARKLAENKYIKRGIDYVVDVGCHKLEDLLSTFEKISAKLKETMLTTAQQIRKEGMQQGLEKTAKEMLQDKMPKEQISKWTGLDLQQIDKLFQESRESTHK